jgi:hypothetical protein
MTTLSLLGGDWELEFEDEFVAGGTNRQGLRRLNYVSGPVRTSNEVYSAVAENADEFQAMGFSNPMLPVTPNAYTMENKWFISRASTEWLKEGTISASWGLSALPDGSGNGVLMVGYTGGTDFVAGDIGREVVQGGTDSGTLLDFEVLPNGDKVAWIRPSDSTPVTGDLFDGTGALVATGGTGSSTSSVAGVAGDIQYTAVQAIGSVPTATEVYIIQDRVKLANAADNTGFQFWDTDPNVSLGIISVLIRTKLNGTNIADGDLEVFARRYTALYDNFRLNVSAGGFSALPLASSPDINNTTGVYSMTTTSSTNAFNVGNLIYVSGGGFSAATKKGVITAVSGTNPTVTIEYYLVGDLTQFVNSDSLIEYDPVAAADGDATATANVISNNAGGPLDTGTGGGNITFTIGNTTSDFDNSGVAEPYSITVNCDAKATGIVYEKMKHVCTRGQDNTFWNTVSCSIPGEQWRGLEAAVYTVAGTGTMVEGEDVFGETGTGSTLTNYTARIIGINSGTGEGVSQAFVTLADQQTSLPSLTDGNLLADSGSVDDIEVDTGGAGGAIVTLAASKASPFGTYTGTQIFGAPGTLFTNLGAGDSQNYILTDALSTLRTPPNTISFTVTNTRAGDRVFVARDTTTAGVIDKDQFGGMTVTSQGATSITVGGTVDTEVPQAAVVRVVENTLQQEHRYYYSSRTTGASGVFTLTAPTAGTGTVTSASSTQIIDSGALFSTGATPVEVGMLVRNTFAGKTTHVWEVTGVADGTLDVRALYGPLDATQDWDVGDTFEINRTIQAYAVTDDIFDLILDYEEDVGTDGTPGTMSNTFVKAGGSFGTVVQVRKGKDILPFQLNQTVGQSNVSVTAVRTPDTIAV